MGEAMDRGMVLVLSLWDDHDANMLWLDGEYPLDKVPLAQLGGGRHVFCPPTISVHSVYFASPCHPPF